MHGFRRYWTSVAVCPVIATDTFKFPLQSFGCYYGITNVLVDKHVSDRLGNKNGTKP
jgi:hypothetical protein